MPRANRYFIPADISHLQVVRKTLRNSLYKNSWFVDYFSVIYDEKLLNHQKYFMQLTFDVSEKELLLIKQQKKSYLLKKNNHKGRTQYNYTSQIPLSVHQTVLVSNRFLNLKK